MGGSYRECTQCGKRALSIATRCPGCGCEFPDPIVPESGGLRELSRFLTPGAVVAVVLAAVAALTLPKLGRISRPAEEHSAYIAAESLADFSEVASSAATTAPAGTGTGAPPPAAAGELRVARTWTNVRRSRSTRAPLEAMLLPGDTVLADSLERDWYRVALEGEVLGYAHRSTLVAAGSRAGRSDEGAGRPGS